MRWARLRNGYRLGGHPGKRVRGDSSLRIAHFNNIANVAWTLSRAQRALGHEAVVYAFSGDPYGFPADVRERTYHGPELWNLQMAARWREFSTFDVLHVHYGISRKEPVYPVFARFFGKGLAVHLHGSEARSGRGLHYLGASDVIFASTPDLLDIVPEAEWLPNPIELAALPEPGPPHERSRFGHFVSSPVHKGTSQVVASFREAFPGATVSRQGKLTWYRAPETELLVANRVPHTQALELMASSDVIVDQITPYGIYGLVAIEGMALRKPVLASVRSNWYPGCPVVPIDRTTAPDRMRALAADPSARERLGREGRAYVERVHGASAIARRTLAAYARA